MPGRRRKGRGKLWGEIQGDTIKFDWAGQMHTGRGKWTFKPGSNESSVSLGANSGSGEAKFNLTKIESVPAQIVDISGTYVSDRIVRNYDLWVFRYIPKLSITLRQENNSIKGQFIDSLDGPIYGTNDNGNIEFKWEAGNCSSGEGSLSVNPDGSTLQGFLLCRSQGMAKFDVIFRRM